MQIHARLDNELKVELPLASKGVANASAALSMLTVNGLDNASVLVRWAGATDNVSVTIQSTVDGTTWVDYLTLGGDKDLTEGQQARLPLNDAVAIRAYVATTSASTAGTATVFIAV